MYWDGEATPSVEAPIGDFFGLGLGDYFLYQSAPLQVGSDKALNCFFPHAVPEARAHHGDQRRAEKRETRSTSTSTTALTPSRYQRTALFPRAVSPSRARPRLDRISGRSNGDPRSRQRKI